MSILVTRSGIAEVRARLSGLRDTGEQVAEPVGELVAAQTRERLANEKTGPDGRPWAPWRDQSRRGALLEDTGALLRSIGARLSGQAIEVGSALPYAAVHQRGSLRSGIPAREFLGLSDENARNVERLVIRRLEEALS